MVAPHMISVILTYRNNTETLRNCCEALLTQSQPEALGEVSLVVPSNDTSCSNIAADILKQQLGAVEQYRASEDIFEAKTRALQAAKGDIVLFLDDDCCPNPNLLERHLSLHENLPRSSTAILGKISISKNLSKKLFSHILFQHCLLVPSNGNIENFAYGHDFFCTRNLSIHRDTLLRLLPPTLPPLCSRWGQDIALGYGLWKRGVRVYFSSDAAITLEVVPSIREFLSELYARGQDFAELLLTHRELMAPYLDHGDIFQNDLSAWAAMHRESEKNIEGLIHQVEAIENTPIEAIPAAKLANITKQIGDMLWSLVLFARREAVLKQDPERRHAYITLEKN